MMAPSRPLIILPYTGLKIFSATSCRSNPSAIRHESRQADERNGEPQVASTGPIVIRSEIERPEAIRPATDRSVEDSVSIHSIEQPSDANPAPISPSDHDCDVRSRLDSTDVLSRDITSKCYAVMSEAFRCTDSASNAAESETGILRGDEGDDDLSHQAYQEDTTEDGHREARSDVRFGDDDDSPPQPCLADIDQSLSSEVPLTSNTTEQERNGGWSIDAGRNLTDRDDEESQTANRESCIKAPSSDSQQERSALSSLGNRATQTVPIPVIDKPTRLDANIAKWPISGLLTRTTLGLEDFYTLELPVDRLRYQIPSSATLVSSHFHASQEVAYSSDNDKRVGDSAAGSRSRRIWSRFTENDDLLLIELKEQQRLSWSQIKCHFPNRNAASLQTHYFAKLKKRKPQKRQRSTGGGRRSKRKGARNLEAPAEASTESLTASVTAEAQPRLRSSARQRRPTVKAKAAAENCFRTPRL